MKQHPDADMLPTHDSSARRCLVVMYHYVGQASIGPGGGVRGLSAAEFREQVELLTQTLEPVGWPDVDRWIHGERDLPRDAFLLTFDDGLRCHCDVAAQILDELRVPGLFFLPTRTIDERSMLTAHMLHLVLDRVPDDKLITELVEVSEVESLAGRLLREGSAQASRVYHYESEGRARLKYTLNMVLPQVVRDRVSRVLFERHVGSTADWADRWYLNWSDARELIARGHSIGGHGHSHDPYALMSDAECASDMRANLSVLRANLGPASYALAYPFGSVNVSVARAACDAGFRAAFATHREWASRRADRFQVPRVDTIYVDEFVKEAAACHA